MNSAPIIHIMDSIKKCNTSILKYAPNRLQPCLASTTAHAIHPALKAEL